MKRMSNSAISMIAATVGGLSAVLIYQLALAGNGPLPAPKFNVESTPVARESRLTSFAPVIKKAAPSVVNIYSTRVFRVQPYEDPFHSFFGDDSPRHRSRLFRAEGLGSGVIVSSDGYILTASHVIEDADEVKVALADGDRQLDVKVVGSDPATDIAVLKVDAKNLPAITLADSDKLEVGDVALAIGNPFEVGQTVTMGIVSALGRHGVGLNDYENFIQTDAAINPGNSGGALVDAEGRLIGINTAILSRSGGNQGIGFAVPVNLARDVMERIIKDGKVTRGYLGVNIQSVDGELASEMKLPVSSGVLVRDVMPGTPAEKAGIKVRDVIVALNGNKVADSGQLRLAISELSPQSKVALKVIRTGGEKTLTASLAELPQDMAVNNRNESRDNGGEVLQGVSVTDLTSRLRRQFNVPNRVQGAIVTDVAADSSANQLGLQPGDVITEINHQPVSNAKDAVSLITNASGSRMLVRIWSRDEDGNPQMRFLVVRNQQ